MNLRKLKKFSNNKIFCLILFNGEIALNEADKDQSSLLKRKQNQKSLAKKKKKNRKKILLKVYMQFLKVEKEFLKVLKQNEIKK